jgi:hypothetical protein
MTDGNGIGTEVFLDASYYLAVFAVDRTELQ